MKTFLLISSLLFVVAEVQGQWSNTGFNYTTDRLGIGTSSWSGKRLVVLGNDADHVSYFENLHSSGYGIAIKATNDPLRIVPASGTGDYLFVVGGNGNVGIGTSTPSTRLSFGTIINSRIISLWDDTNLWYGFGLQGSQMRLQVGDNNARFSFFAGDANEVLTVKGNGNVGIGTTSPDSKLTVNGQVHATEVKVTTTVPAPDYVFEKSYKLPTLDEVKSYIDQNKHLPDVPSATEIDNRGLMLGEMNMALLKKVEELTLYVIELKERDIAQQKEIDALKSKK